ncbi:hypothetical protein F4604DRAFT_1677040 [Suillus subluteus]|nr:hypothetical protein F4604DRAFT_1677040 [Suillus subluteus]
MQWSADPTEHTHITVVKEPARAGNNHDHDAQICRYLNYCDKVEHFDLVLKMRELEHCADIGDDSDNEDIDSRMVWRSVKDYFACACEFLDAYSLGYNPSLTKMTVNKAAKQFLLPDFVLQFPIIWTVPQNMMSSLLLAVEQLEPSQVMLAEPPSKEWPYGRYDSIIVNADKTYKWPKSGLEGHFVAHLHLIFRLITALSYADTYLPMLSVWM